MRERVDPSRTVCRVEVEVWHATSEKRVSLFEVVGDIEAVNECGDLDLRDQVAAGRPPAGEVDSPAITVPKRKGFAIEFKSQVGPSFGNNFNNRVEEAIGNATDIWTAYREGRFGTAPRPFLGYFFLLEDAPKVHTPVKLVEPYFTVDPVFQDATYATRYEILCRRLLRERLYDTTCLTLSTRERPSTISHPADDLTFDRFVAALQGHAYAFGRSQG